MTKMRFFWGEVERILTFVLYVFKWFCCLVGISLFLAVVFNIDFLKDIFSSLLNLGGK